MPDIEVDSDRLVAFATRLLQVKSVLQGEDHGSGWADAVGSGEVAASLSGFLLGWSEACAQLCAVIDRCHGDLNAAAQSYAAQERALAADLAPRAGAPGSG